VRLLALDVGDRRVGVAVSDELGMCARPLTVITRRSREEDYQAIVRLATEYQIARLIVGHPLEMSGEVGPQARRVERYVAGLGERLTVPTTLWDERLSTWAAEDLLHQAGESTRQFRGRIDAVAAAVILQSYLDATAEKERSVD
jgi:putative holliday junction resolvase